MYGNFECPECGKDLHQKSIKCACGWKKSRIEEKNEIPMICAHTGCGMKVYTKYPMFWLCREHDDDFILKESPDSPVAMVIRRIRGLES